MAQPLRSRTRTQPHYPHRLQPVLPFRRVEHPRLQHLMPLPQLAAQDDALSELLQLINRQLTEKGLKVEKASAAVIDATIIQTAGSKHRRFVGVMPALLALDNQFFAGNTADVDASAAVHLRRLFHQHDLLPVFRQIRRQRFARFAKADNKILCVHNLSP